MGQEKLPLQVESKEKLTCACPKCLQLAAENKTAYRSPVEGCKCHTCRSHTLAYLHHLLKAREPLAASLLSIHNIRVMCDIMSDLRLKILADEI